MWFWSFFLSVSQTINLKMCLNQCLCYFISSRRTEISTNKTEWEPFYSSSPQLQTGGPTCGFLAGSCAIIVWKGFPWACETLIYSLYKTFFKCLEFLLLVHLLKWEVRVLSENGLSPFWAFEPLRTRSKDRFEYFQRRVEVPFECLGSVLISWKEQDRDFCVFCQSVLNPLKIIGLRQLITVCVHTEPMTRSNGGVYIAQWFFTFLEVPNRTS